ncbi:HU-related DNA-binding protein HupN [soil metagenome]
MRKSEFIDKVARKAEMSRESAARAVEAIFDTTNGALAEAIRLGGKVSLPGFGRFRTKKRAARRGRNPQTGELIDIPERMVIHFTAGKGLQDVLDDTDSVQTKKPAAKTRPSTQR